MPNRKSAANPAPNSAPGEAATVIDALRAVIGDDRVETSPERRVFFATDMSRSGAAPVAVIRPETVAALEAAIPLCIAAGLAVIPRGGGFSYTGGYVPEDENSVIVDLRSLDRIVEINREDMYVIVETGCTWHTLYEALKAQGLRTPYFGPMSGYGATIGGALSQGSFFLGSSQYGPVAESVLSVEVVLADGSTIRTGSWGSNNGAAPFYRTYGPDLTGLFLGDTGAMGFKTKAVLKLVPFPAHTQFASFAFTDESDAVATLSAIGRQAIAAECYCWDPYFVKIMAAASETLTEDLKFLAGVARGGGSLRQGLFNATRVAMAGKSNFSGDVFMLNVTLDDPSRAGADARLKIVRGIAAEHHAKEVTPSAPMAMRGTPFVNFNTPDRRRPMRNLPTNSLAPHSRLAAVSVDIRALLAQRQAEMDAHGLECGVVYFAVGAQAACMEPLIYWDDHEHFNHDRVGESSDLDALKRYAERPAATQLAVSIRKEMTDIFTRHGCSHVQIGKSYPWLATRDAPVAKLAAAIKRQLDPTLSVNPGSLGFS